MWGVGDLARLVLAGATFSTEFKREGNLIWPTLLDNVTPSMRLAWEEPFGPVLPIIRVSCALHAGLAMLCCLAPGG